MVAPKPLVWLHERFGISEGPAEEVAAKEPMDMEISVQHNGHPVTHPITESVTQIG